MRRIHWIIIITLGLVSSVTVIAANVTDDIDSEIGSLETLSPAANILANPSFEGQYSSYIPPGGHPDCPSGICQTAQMSDGWTPWWTSHDDDDPDWIIRNPEYKPAAPWANRIHSGDNAQQYFSFYSTHQAGIYQRVSAEPGKQYRFTIWGHSWASTNDNPYTSDVPLTQRIGIDPTGGTNWKSSNVLWSPPHQQHDEYGLFTVCAVANSNHITVFTFSEPEWPGKHNDVYWDDAELKTHNGQCQIGMQVEEDNGVGMLSAIDNPETKNLPVTIILPDVPGIGWEAEVEAGGSLTPTLSATSGTAGEALIVTIDSHGFPLGTFGTTISINSVPSVIGSPVVIPVYLTVVEEILHAYIPIADHN